MPHHVEVKNSYKLLKKIIVNLSSFEFFKYYVHFITPVQMRCHSLHLRVLRVPNSAWLNIRHLYVIEL